MHSPSHFSERGLNIGRRRAKAVHAAGGSAMQAASAHFSGSFSSSGLIQDFKSRIAKIIQHGPNHPWVKWRYRKVTEECCNNNLDLRLTILLIELTYRNDKKARECHIAAWGHTSRPRITAEILAELRLILRLMRRYAPETFLTLETAKKEITP